MADNSTVKIEILFNPLDGSLKVNGPFKSPVVFLGMLEAAKNMMLRDHNARLARQESRIAMPNGGN